MNIVVNRAELLDALSFCNQKVISSRAIIPEWRMLFLHGQRGELVVAGCSSELFASRTIGGKLSGSAASICVLPTQIIGVVQNLPDEELTLEFDEDKLKVKSPFANTTLKGLPGTDYPEFPMADKKLLDLTPAMMNTIKKLFVPFTLPESDSSYPQFHGVRLLRKDGLFSMWSFAQHRASYIEEVQLGDDFDYNVLGTALDKASEFGTVQLWTSQKSGWVILSGQDQFIACPLLDGNWIPVAEHAKPREDTKLICNSSELAKTIRLINAAFGGEKYRSVSLHAQGGIVTISAKTDNGDDVVKTLDAQTSGDGLGVRVDSNYLLEIVSALDGDIEIAFIDPTKEQRFNAVQIRQVDEPRFVHTIAPYGSK